MNTNILKLLVDSMMNQIHSHPGLQPIAKWMFNQDAGRYFGRWIKLGRNIKYLRAKLPKLDPSLLVRKMLTLLQSPLPPCPCGHTIIFEKSFAIKNVGCAHLENSLPLVRKMPAMANPPPLLMTTDVFY